MELFRHQARRNKRGEPLAMRMRPKSLEDFFGQSHLVGAGKMLHRAIESDRVPSMILWGPPGVGKTTLAQIVAEKTGARFVTISAVGAGVKELRENVAIASEQRDLYGKQTILFIDEIHRFNKAQQDALLPHVETGTITLIGATTENPSFEVIAALLSRSRVLRLESLSATELFGILKRALQHDKQLAEASVEIADDLLTLVAEAAQGDARRALTTLEVAVSLTADGQAVDRETVAQALQQKTLLYDKSGEEHYNVISAFIKSMRGSDADASVYWLVRMLESGEDPLFLLRRMVIFASEDIGNADPAALQVATAALAAFRFIGLPEGALALTQTALYLASAPKSNTVLTTYGKVRKDVRDRGPLPVPLHLRNAPTQLMKASGYGKGYRYPHNFSDANVEQQYLPDDLKDCRYYEPKGKEADNLRAAQSASGTGDEADGEALE